MNVSINFLIDGSSRHCCGRERENDTTASFSTAASEELVNKPMLNALSTKNPTDDTAFPCTLVFYA